MAVVKPTITAKEFLEPTGGRSLEVGSMLAVQAIQVLPGAASGGTTCQLAVNLLGEMAPRNAIEGMLAVQIIGVHNAAVEFMRRSQLPNQPLEAVDSNINRAVRLMRLFPDQLGAMAKLKGTAGQQKMTVEHVHVHAGGQAIVGPVARGKGTQEEAGSTSDSRRINP